MWIPELAFLHQQTQTQYPVLMELMGKNKKKTLNLGNLEKILLDGVAQTEAAGFKMIIWQIIELIHHDSNVPESFSNC